MVQGLIIFILANQEAGFGHPFEPKWAARKVESLTRLAVQGCSDTLDSKLWKPCDKYGTTVANEGTVLCTDNGDVYFFDQDSRPRMISPVSFVPTAVDESVVVPTVKLAALCKSLMNESGYPVDVKIDRVVLKRVGDNATGLVREISVDFSPMYKGYLMAGYKPGFAEFEPGSGRLMNMNLPKPVRIPESLECNITLDQARAVMTGEAFKKGFNDYDVTFEPRPMIVAVDPQNRELDALKLMAWEKLPPSFLSYFGVFRERAPWVKDKTEHTLTVCVDAATGKTVFAREQTTPTN